MVTLKVIEGPDCGKSWTFENGVYKLGRSSACNFKFEDEFLSREHLEIIVQNSLVSIRDLESKHGTHINTEPVKENIKINFGSQIRLGRFTLISFYGDFENENLPNSRCIKPEIVISPGEQPIPNSTNNESHETFPIVPSTELHENSIQNNKILKENIQQVSDACNFSEDLTEPGNTSSQSKPLVCEQTHDDFKQDLNQDPPTTGNTNVEDNTEIDDPKTAIGSLSEVEDVRLRFAKLREIRTVLLFLFIASLLCTFWLSKKFSQKKPLSPKSFAGIEFFHNSKKVLDFEFPSDGKTNVVTNLTEQGVSIECWLGEQNNIPLRLELTTFSDNNYLNQSLEDTLNDWIKKKKNENEGQWDPGPSRLSRLFLGTDQGVPAKAIYYYRDQAKWIGTAVVFRQGKTLFVRTAEILSSNIERAENLIENSYIRLSNDFVKSHWEGDRPSNLDKPFSSEEIEGFDELCLVPLDWPYLHKRLRGTLVDAELNQNVDILGKAIDCLNSLREKESSYFSSIILTRRKKQNANQIESFNIWADQCTKVFSDPNDLRFFTVRKWLLEN